MKKKTVILFVVMILATMCSCSGGKNSNTSDKDSNLPGTIQFLDATMTYGDSKIPVKFKYADVDFNVNEKSEIVLIRIKGKEIVTYKGISVGDSSKTIRDKFKYNKDEGSSYLVSFVKNKEVEYDKYEDDKDLFLIKYIIEDDYITQIELKKRHVD